MNYDSRSTKSDLQLFSRLTKLQSLAAHAAWEAADRVSAATQTLSKQHLLQLAKPMHAAAANAMRLLLEQSAKAEQVTLDRSAMVTGTLCIAASNCWHGASDVSPLLLLGKAAIQSGVVATLPAACSLALKLLEQLADKGDNSQLQLIEHYAPVNLAAGLLELWANISASLPTEVTEQHNLRPSHSQAASLGVTLLQLQEPCLAEGTSSGVSGGDNSSAAVRCLDMYCHGKAAAVHAGKQLASWFAEQDFSKAGNHSEVHPMPAMALLQTPDIVTLLLMHLGCMTQVLHQRLGGMSAATVPINPTLRGSAAAAQSNQAQVELQPAHKQLLQHLKVVLPPDVQALVASAESTPLSDLQRTCLHAVLYTCVAAADGKVAALYPETAVSVALVLMESVMMQPLADRNVKFVGMLAAAARGMLAQPACFELHWNGCEVRSDPQVAGPAAARGEASDRPSSAQQLHQLLGVILHQVMPAILLAYRKPQQPAAPADAAAARAEDANFGSQEELSTLVMQLMVMLSWWRTRSRSDFGSSMVLQDLEPLVAEQPLASITSLESVCRRAITARDKYEASTTMKDVLLLLSSEGEEEDGEGDAQSGGADDALRQQLLQRAAADGPAGLFGSMMSLLTTAVKLTRGMGGLGEQPSVVRILDAISSMHRIVSATSPAGGSSMEPSSTTASITAGAFTTTTSITAGTSNNTGIADSSSSSNGGGGGTMRHHLLAMQGRMLHAMSQYLSRRVVRTEFLARQWQDLQRWQPGLQGSHRPAGWQPPSPGLPDPWQETDLLDLAADCRRVVGALQDCSQALQQQQALPEAVLQGLLQKCGSLVELLEAFIIATGSASTGHAATRSSSNNGNNNSSDGSSCRESSSGDGNGRGSSSSHTSSRAGSPPLAVPSTNSRSDELHSWLQQLAGAFKQLLQFAAALITELPSAFMCNNPECSSLAKETELLAASKLCSKCKVAHYDCKACLEAHWREHRKVCRRLRPPAAQPVGEDIP